MDSATEDMYASTRQIVGAAREQAEKASQMPAEIATERQTLSKQGFDAYIHASAIAVRGMQQFWIGFLQASIRNAAAAASFGWTPRR